MLFNIGEFGKTQKPVFFPLCDSYKIIDRSPAQVVPRLLSTINCSNSAATVTINTENQHFEWGKISGKSKNQDWLGKTTVHTTTLYKQISLQKILDH